MTVNGHNLTVTFNYTNMGRTVEVPDDCDSQCFYSRDGALGTPGTDQNPFYCFSMGSGGPDSYSCNKNCSDSGAIYSSIGFSIDNTGSVRDVGGNVIRLTNELLSIVANQNYTIPNWVLTTFNDHGDNITQNVDLRLETTSMAHFSSSLNLIRFSGGGDDSEQAMQGLYVTLDKMPHNGVVLLFTDSPTKNLHLQAQLIAMRDEKEITIFVVLTPGYFGTKHDASWKVYVNLSEGRIYDLLNFDKDQFFQEVVHVIGSSCAGKVSSDLFSARVVPDLTHGWETRPEEFFLPKEDSPAQESD